MCRAGATWFFNEACRSQRDRYLHHVPIESKESLSYAVSAARIAGCEFRYRDKMWLISEVPSVFLHGALRQLSASWTRHLKSWTRHLKMKREGEIILQPGSRLIPETWGQPGARKRPERRRSRRPKRRSRGNGP